MQVISTMGRHKEWRKVAKKERRRRIRTENAKNLAEEYNNWLISEKAMETIEMEQIEITNKEENDKWIKAEIMFMEKLKRLEVTNTILKIKKQQEEAKRKLEWELEQKKRQEEAQRLKEIEEENIRRQKIFMENLENFLNGDSENPPPELLVVRETKPKMELCPFFAKTACCRFGDQCSRNHRYPAISKVLLATNFYLHFGLDNSDVTEYDTDIMLEYDENDTYKDFKDFFFDVLPEFEKFGKVVQFKVCYNFEKHLRGNTYVEYSDLRSAVTAYRALHSRWYGGRQLSLQFCEINLWRRAICGLHPQRRCPKGRSCNFLHAFKNPNDLFSDYNEYGDRQKRTSPRSWRWSASPERECSPRRKRSSSRHKKESTKRRSSSKDARDKDKKTSRRKKK
ncbi:unnamed protein product, partial [Iphiclides podalirius]